MEPTEFLDRYINDSDLTQRRIIIKKIQQAAVDCAQNDFGKQPSAIHKEFVNLYLLVKEDASK
jgi:hypothetical protein